MTDTTNKKKLVARIIRVRTRYRTLMERKHPEAYVRQRDAEVIELMCDLIADSIDISPDPPYVLSDSRGLYLRLIQVTNVGCRVAYVDWVIVHRSVTLPDKNTAVCSVETVYVDLPHRCFDTIDNVYQLNRCIDNVFVRLNVPVIQSLVESFKNDTAIW